MYLHVFNQTGGILFHPLCERLNRWPNCGNEQKTMQRDKLPRRLRQLYVVEFINVFWLPLAFWFVGQISNQELGLNSIVAMILNGILLMEGSYLWLCISRQLRAKRQYDFTQIFRVLKVLNFGI